MSTIRIHKHLDSETLHLPELKSLVGKDVEIMVWEKTDSTSESKSHGRIVPPPWTHVSKSIAQIAQEQGVPPKSVEQLDFGGWPEDQLDDGFEAAVRAWRQENSEPESRQQNNS